MDQKLLFLINEQWTSPALDSFMATLSCFAAWAPLIVLVVLLTLMLGGFRARAMIFTLGIVMVFSDVIVADSIKPIVGRARPREALAGVRVVDLQPGTIRMLSAFKPAQVTLTQPPPDHPHGHSFPSSHTLNNFSAATVLTLFYRKRGWLYFIPAALIGYSRIYVGAHWPSDILLSAPMGILLGSILVAVIAWLWRKFAPDYFPEIFKRHPRLLERKPAA